MMLTVYRDQARFKTTYLTPVRGCYYSGDGAFVDTAHQLWITGRIDDVIKVSGHRLGSGEIESALISHPAVAEAAVVGLLDELKGEVVVAFVHLRADNTADDTLKQQLIQCVRRHVGAIAAPQIIHWAPFGLPKTRSGKIVRRVLRMLASHRYDDLGDLSTLADRHALDEWINAMQQR
jgi:acetyl-CoA synthetase